MQCKKYLCIPAFITSPSVNSPISSQRLTGRVWHYWGGGGGGGGGGFTISSELLKEHSQLTGFKKLLTQLYNNWMIAENHHQKNRVLQKWLPRWSEGENGILRFIHKCVRTGFNIVCTIFNFEIHYESSFHWGVNVSEKNNPCKIMERFNIYKSTKLTKPNMQINIF